MNKKLGLFFCLAIFLTGVALLAQDNANVHYFFSAAGRLIGSVDANGNAKVYTYDAAGNLTSVERLAPRGDVDIFFVDPNHGGPGTQVTIFGMGFSQAPSDNQVAFNGTSALVAAATASSLTVIVPDGATTGPVRVTSPLGAAASRSAFTVEAACADLSGLVSWWPGEGNANDIIGNHHGQVMAGFQRGKVGRAFQFNGVNQFVDIPSINLARTFSVEFWVFPRSTVDRQHLVSNNPDTSNFGELSFRDSGRVDYHQGSGGTIILSNGDVPINTWSHVALTYDGLRTRIYVNGTLKGTSNAHDEIFNNPVRLGYSVRGDFNYFSGLLDEVSLYSRALSESEIQAIVAAGSVGKCKRLSIVTTQLPDGAVGQPASYQIETRFGVAPLTFSVAAGNLPPGMTLDPQTGIVSGAPTTAGTFTFTAQVSDAAGAVAVGTIRITIGTCDPAPAGLVSWWPGEGNANDIIGNNHGTLRGSGASFAPGRVGQAFQFNGVDQFVDLPTINLGRTFSVEFWVFPRRAVDVQHLVSNNRDGGNFGELSFRDTGRVDYLQGSGGTILMDNGEVPFNTWSHVALTYDGSRARLYVNGSLKGTSNAHNEVFNNPVRLGYSVLEDRNFFGGLLDEVSLYSRALSDSEIQAIANAGGVGKCRPR